MDPITRVTAPTLDVLAALLDSGAPTWGLVVIKHTGRLPGTVYPVLERLERLGWLTSSWEDDADRAGPRRRLYEFTAEGRPAAEALLAERAARRDAASAPGRPASSRPRTSGRPVTS